MGNLGIRTNTLYAGFNLMGFGEGWYNVTFNRVFTNLVSGSLTSHGSLDSRADQIIVLNPNGSYSRFWYSTAGWRNTANDALATTNTFLPGSGYYFKRVVTSGVFRVRF